MLHSASAHEGRHVVGVVGGVGDGPRCFTQPGALVQCMDAGQQHVLCGAGTQRGVAQEDFDGLQRPCVIRVLADQQREALQVRKSQDARLLRARVTATVVELDESRDSEQVLAAIVQVYLCTCRLMYHICPLDDSVSRVHVLQGRQVQSLQQAVLFNSTSCYIIIGGPHPPYPHHRTQFPRQPAHLFAFKFRCIHRRTCLAHISAYLPPSDSSSAWVPRSSTRPCVLTLCTLSR